MKEKKIKFISAWLMLILTLGFVGTVKHSPATIQAKTNLTSLSKKQLRARISSAKKKSLSLKADASSLRVLSTSLASLEASANSQATSQATSQVQASSEVSQAQTSSVTTGQTGQIVGNRNTHVYHVPGQARYSMKTANAVYFNTEAEAQAAGYRKAQR